MDVNINMREETPILDESGITISLSRVQAGGKSLKWRNLDIVRIERKGNLLTKAIRPTFSLVVSTKENPAPFSFFETKDVELMNKMQTAIGTVARHLGAKKDS